MFAVLDGAIQHFPARNLSYFKDGDYDFYDDSGNKIDNADLESAAEKEIEEHTIHFDGTEEGFIASLKENGIDMDASVPFRIYPTGDINSDPMTKALGGDNNG